MTGWRKIDEVPFDFERRRVSVLVEHDAKRRLIVKGAPEDLLRLSGRYEDADGEEQPLDAETRHALLPTSRARRHAHFCDSSMTDCRNIGVMLGR